MATVYEKPKGSGIWYLAWREGPPGARVNRAKPLEGVRTRKQATDALKLYEAGEVRGEKIIPGLATLEEVIALFARQKKATAAASTGIYYRTHFRNFATRLPCEKPLAAISTVMLEAFRDARAEEAHPATVNKELGTLRALWRFALKRGLTTHDPIAAVVDLRDERDPDDEPEPAQAWVVAFTLLVLRWMARELRDDRAEAYRTFARALRIGWHTGLRLGEMCRLKPSDLRADGGLRVRAHAVKGGGRWSYRWTACPTPVLRLLRRLARGGHATLLVSERTGGSAYSSLRQLRDGFVKKHPFLKTAGFHSLRHAMATRSAEVLEDSTRSEILGHRNVEQTESYTHRDVERIRAAQDAVRAAERSRRRT